MDAPHMRSGQRSILGMLASTVLIMFSIVACAAVLVFSVDAACVASVNEWVPEYPDAEVVDEWYDFFRAKGMGRSRVTYFTPDDRMEVIRFYQRHQSNMMRHNTLASSGYRVQDATEGEGTRIVIFSQCAFN